MYVIDVIRWTMNSGLALFFTIISIMILIFGVLYTIITRDKDEIGFFIKFSVSFFIMTFVIVTMTYHISEDYEVAKYQKEIFLEKIKENEIPKVRTNMCCILCE